MSNVFRRFVAFLESKIVFLFVIMAAAMVFLAVSSGVETELGVAEADIGTVGVVELAYCSSLSDDRCPPSAMVIRYEVRSRSLPVAERYGYD